MARDLQVGIALVATVLAAIHLLYAAGGGIAATMAARWALACGTVLAAALAWAAARRGPWWLAWPALALCILPVAVTWPAAAVSLAGLAVLALLAVLSLGLAVETFRRARAD